MAQPTLRPELPQGYRSLVSALSVGQILSWAFVYYGFSSFVLPMMAELGWSKSLVMGANTLGLLVWGLATYAAGAAVDRGKARWLMSAGCFLAACGFAVWAQATHPAMLYAAWFLLGLASAFTLYEPAFNVLTRRFPQHYRQGIITLTLVGGFASTLSFPVVSFLIHTLGWRGALWCLAAAMALLLVPLHWWALQGSSVARAAKPDPTEPTTTLSQALRLRAFWWLTASFACYSIVMAAFWAHVMPLLASKGLSQAESLWVLVGVGPAQVLGRWVLARFGASVNLRRLGFVVLTAMPASLLMMAASSQLAALILAACVYGVANGLVTIVRGALVPEYFGRIHIGRIGGAMSGVGLVARAAGPLLVAAWLLWVPDYDAALLALAAMAGVSALCFVFAGRPALNR